jgi:Salmonella virulence plasmid 65kDa B protein/FG-GAP-like repeat/Insecticide toxin TcdB middle/N-terminal region
MRFLFAFPFALNVAARGRTHCLAVWLATLMGFTGSHVMAQTIDVGASGQPSYNYAIQVPPGVAGVVPSVGLSHDGGGVNGPVGYGWSLRGVSAITRCPQTRAIDGFTRGVAYDGNDKLCLDGQRLIQVDPSTGAVINESNTSATSSNPFQTGDALGLASGFREYRTERETFSRIRAYGSAAAAADGPLYFKVWTKAGQIYEYGTATNTMANATIPAQGRTATTAWVVSRISDGAGNYIDFQYDQRDTAWGSVSSSDTTSTTAATGREWNLSEIRYTGTSTSAPKNKVIFTYEDRPNAADLSSRQDRSETYHLGSKNVSIRRLSTITTALIADNGSLLPVKTVKLAYTNGTRSQRSLLRSITECGGAAQNRCLPPTTFTYTDGGGDAYVASAQFDNSGLATTALQDGSGDTGVLVGDFNGDGRSDLLVWSSTPSKSKLYTSNGNGTFAESTAFNLTTQKLFSNDGCYQSMVADIDGDGIADIIRFSTSTLPDGATCSSYGATEIYRGSATGAFQVLTLQGPTLQRKRAQVTDSCLLPRNTSGICEEPAEHPGWSAGANFYVMDVDGDGRPDILTTVLPALSNTADWVDPCKSQVCTRFYKGQGNGVFVEQATNLSNISIYVPPASGGGISSSAQLADLDGDGLQDLNGIATALQPDAKTDAAYLGMVNVFNQNYAYRSRGDGNFDATNDIQFPCNVFVDFNGDGRADCLYIASGTTTPRLMLFGAGNKLSNVNNFNLGTLKVKNDGYGVMAEDFNGDGRQDLLRWSNTASETQLYLSNGDGTFTASSTFNLNTDALQLRKSDMSSDFVVGDFTGNGNVELLRMKLSPTSGTSTSNHLFVKSDSTPPDLLKTVTTSSGLTTTLTWVPLTNSSSGNWARYVSDRNTAQAAVYPHLDITAPIYVVATRSEQTGVGTATSTTEYRYTGMKASYDSRGAQGFRETRQQTQASDGTSTLVSLTEFLQDYPYSGMPLRSATWLGALADAEVATPLSGSTYIYCNLAARANQTSATSTSPCALPAGARLVWPYLYRVSRSGVDLSGAQQPTEVTTTTYGDWGDPLTVEVKTTGTSVDLSQTFVKTTSNTYLSPITSCSSDTQCRWILGRLSTASQTNTSPSALQTLGASAGTAAAATATTGQAVLPVLSLTLIGGSTSTTVPTVANAIYRVSNNGLTAAQSVQYAVTGGLSLSGGPTSCAASTSDCGTVTVSSASSAGSYSGTLSATPSSGSGTSASVQLSVWTPAQLVVSNCVSASPTTAPTSATLTCSVSNSGQTPITSISYSSVSGVTVNGPTGACAGSSTCGTLTLTTSTAAGHYTGTVTVTPNSGGAASVPVDLTVLTPAQLAWSNCVSTSGTTAPNPATLSCTLTNVGGAAVSAISYSQISGSTVAGPSSCAGSSSCGSVVVTSGTSAGSYVGTLTATPNVGTAASVAINLQVLTPAQLVLSCSSPTITTSPTASVMSCAVSNSGQTAVKSITYGAISNVSINGPTGVCAGGGSCGTVTLTSSTAVGHYTGTLTLAPDTGTGASAGVDMTVYAAPVITSATLPSYQTVGQGGTLSWAASNASSTAASCTGQLVGSAAGSAAGGSLSVGASAAGTGTCTVTATNPAGASVSTTLASTVVAAPQFISFGVRFYPTATVQVGSTTSFQWIMTDAVSATVNCGGGATGSTTQSYTPGGELSGTLTVTGSYISSTAACSVVLVNAAGTSVGNSATLNVVAAGTTLTPSTTLDSFSTSANGSATHTYTITNTGAGSATGLAMKIQNRTGSGSGFFSVVSGGTCTSGATLGVGASCTVKVTWSAGCGAASNNTAELLVSSTAGGTPASITLSGSYSKGTCL